MGTEDIPLCLSWRGNSTSEWREMIMEILYFFQVFNIEDHFKFI